MTPDHLFAAAGPVVSLGWLLLLLAPRWRWTHRLAALGIPLLLATIYLTLLITTPRPAGAGFGSLAAVARLFSAPPLLLAGWLHYLAFDLFIGAWQTRDALRLGMSRWLLTPCLVLTFLFGPVGLALYLLLRLTLRRQTGFALESA